MQRITILIVPGIIAVALYFAISGFEPGGETDDAITTPIELAFNAYSEGINSVLYDEDGAIQYTLQADRQVHFNDDSTELDNPLIRLYQEDDSVWNIVANSGRISAARDTTGSRARLIELSGQVEVYSLDDFGNRTVLSTDALSVDPQAETLETDRPVTLVTTNLRQSSIGMFADLKTDEIVFYRDIRGVYERTIN